MRDHNRLCISVVHELVTAGHHAASEVGIRGGRLDVAGIDSHDRITWILEVKLTAHERGLSQLLRYARIVGGSPRLTLVVQPEAATADLIAKAEAVDIEVWARDYGPRQRRDWSALPGRWRHLPYIDRDVMSEFLARRKRERSEEVAA